MKQQLSYRDLQSHVADSIALREFCQVGFQDVPAFTTLQENMKRIRPQTWQAINATTVEYACAQDIEDGRPAGPHFAARRNRHRSVDGC